MGMTKRRMVMGLLAHVDAGKTTLSEALLYTGGALRKLGRVDHRDAFLDTDIQEKERGITIFSKQACFAWKQTEITLLDTPGHVDFSGEMERVLPLLECAVLVISAADGIQGHTMTLWRLLERYQVPTFLFINKMDRQDAEKSKLLRVIREKLSENCIDFSNADKAEQIALCSEEALNFYLQYGEIPKGIIGKLISARQLFPCYFGSALRLQGIEALMDGLICYVPERQWPPVFGAKVYKIARDQQGARLTYMKITGGELRVRDLLTNQQGGTSSAQDWAEKVSQIRLYSGAKYQTVEVAAAGMVCAVTGLTFTRPGDSLGIEKAGRTPLLTPVFTYQVLLSAGMDAHVAIKNMRILEEEDPQLQVVWHERTREIHVQLMGEVQLEVLRRLLADRFGMQVSFGEGSILYRETIRNTVEGAGHYEPLRHYAEVHLLLEPGKSGSGLRFVSACSEDDLDRNWQRLILTHLQERQHAGVLTGAPITDMKITLLAGRAHLKHTEGGDFRQATYRAVRQGLMQADSVLLEPWYDIELELPAECLGRAMNDLQQMGGRLMETVTHKDGVTLEAAVPVSKCRYYAKEMAAYTQGRGKMTCALQGYAPCPEQEKTVARIGYLPERDTENPADSVFCAHGAGFVVKWDEAMRYMHVVTGYFDKQKEKTESATTPARRAYRGTLEEDRELMAIFERTYGPIKRDAFRSQVRSSSLPETVTVKEMDKEFLLVDGYNILFAWDELKETARFSLEQARLALCDLLCNYRGMRNCEVILVFDAYKVTGNPGTVEAYNNIYVVYTKEAETADSYIEKTSYEIGKKYHVRVATSDGMEQMIILGNGALRVPASEFKREIEATQGEVSAFLMQNNRYIPDDRIGEAIRSAWRKKHIANEKVE